MQQIASPVAISAQNLFSAARTMAFVSIPVAPAEHKVMIRVEFTLSTADLTRVMHIYVTNTAQDISYWDGYVEITNGDSNEPEHFTIGPIVLDVSDGLKVLVQSDNSSDTNEAVESFLFSDDAEYYWHYNAIPGAATTDSPGQRVMALDLLTEAAGAGDLAAIKTLFDGMTSVAEWLGLLGGKQVGDATARTEMRATGAGSGTYDETIESQEAIRDRGDAAWTTGGAGSISEILNVQPLVPVSIDLANTATVRIGLGLTNQLDDLPSTAEITPGTITIDRKAAGGTSWTTIVSAAAASEAAGLVYYDEVFDSGTGYAEGDTIRVTFKAQKITVAGNDFVITGSDGWIFHTYIRQVTTITAIKAKTDLLGSADISVSSPVAADGQISFTPWDDLYNAESRSLEWTNEDGDWGGGSLANATIQLQIDDTLSDESFNYDGSVVTSSGTQKVRVELGSTDSRNFASGRLYDYHLRAIMPTTGTAHIETLRVSTLAPTFSLFASSS